MNKILPLLVLVIIFCISSANSQTTRTTSTSSATSISSASLEYEGIFGIGWGVFAVILAIIAGLICCIFGISTVYPGVFIAIGICIPLVMFIFMAFTPLEQPGNLNLKDNQATNPYIAVKWFFFAVMLVSLYLLFASFLSVWSSMLIPQRVDSRAQREYFQKYEKLMEEESKLKNEQARKNEEVPLQEINPNSDNMRESRLDINNNREIVVNRGMMNNSNQPKENENIGLINNQNNNNFNDKKKKFLGGLLKRRTNIEDK